MIRAPSKAAQQALAAALKLGTGPPNGTDAASSSIISSSSSSSSSLSA